MTAPDFAAVNYRPSGAANAYQTFDLYLPDATVYTKPAAGWPVVVVVNCTNFTASTKTGALAGDPLYFVDHGFAVCEATVTVKDATVTGGGLFWDTTDGGWATDDIAEKDLIHVIQKLRDLASTYGIDTDAIALYGSEWASATVCQWVGCEADHADSGASTTQEKESSVPMSVYGQSGSWWNPALVSTLAQNHLRDSTTTSAVAATYGDATTAHRQAFSPIYRGFLAPTGGVASVSFYARARGAATNPGEYQVDSSDLPTRVNTQAVETDAWQAMAGMDWLRQHSAGRFFHGRKSTLSTSSSAQYLYADRFYGTGEELPRAARFFQATLGAWPETVATFTAPMRWEKDSDTLRRNGTSLALHAQRRQTALSHSRSGMEDAVRSWRVGHDSITAAELTALQSTVATARTGAQPIEFDMPDAPGSAPVHIIGDSFEYQLVGHDRYSYSLALTEAI